MRSGSGLAVGTLLLLGGCRSAPPRPAGPLAVAAGERSYYLFSALGIELHEGETVESASAIPVEAGFPTAVGADPNAGWAAAAYQRGLYAIQLVEGRLIPLSDAAPWSAPPTAIGVRGGLAGTVEDGTIGLYRITDGTRLWHPPAQEILAQLGVSELRFVLPRSRDELVAVAHEGMGPFSQPSTVVLTVDRAGGRAVVPRSQTIPPLHVLGACASDGEDLYLAGEHDEVRPVQGSVPGRQLTTALVLIHVDPETLEWHEILREERESELRIRQMAVGYGLLALCFESGELEVYRLGERGATRSYSNRYVSPVSAACLDGDHVVIAAPSGSHIQAIP